MATPPSVTRHPARVSYDAEVGRLLVCEYGSVPEERLADHSVDIGQRMRFFLRRPRGTVIGFEVREPDGIDTDGHEPGLWGEPRFRVPALGLRRASVGEILLRARSAFAGRSTADVTTHRDGARLLAARDYARIFTELAPRNSWGWAWLGRVCVELGEEREARRALRRAVALERQGSYRTPAPSVLRSLAGSID